MHILILRMVGLLRLKNSAKKNRILNILYSYVISSFNSYIGKNSQFSSEPNFPHGIKGIFISGGSIIGNNVTIFQGVTIGSNTLIDSNGMGSPIIGDNCYIGAGAKIIGNIRIGKNCRIGANAVVVQDCPDNSLVVNPKSVVIPRKKVMDNSFYFKDGDKWKKMFQGSQVEEKSIEKVQKLNKLTRV